jgi:PAS domain S-box-containing protein
LDTLDNTPTSAQADATTRRLYERLETLMAGQGEVLEMISTGAPLGIILNRIVAWVQTQSTDGALASVLLMDDEGQHLLHGAAPDLPAEYNTAIHGIKIGPDVGSCGTAAYRKLTTIVEDIATDPLWKDYKDLALAHGLHACWSSPLIGRTGKVLGTFAIYYRTPKSPVADDLHILKLVTRTAVLAIEHQQAEEEREQARKAEQVALEGVKEERRRLYQLFMNAPAMIAVLRGPDHVFELANPYYMKAVGADRKIIGKPIMEALPELASQGIFELLSSVYCTGTAHHGNELQISLDRNDDGKLEDCYFDFVYEPLVNDNGEVEGIFVHAVDVTEVVLARKRAEESEKQFRSFIYASPSPIGVYVGREMRIQTVNDAILEAWDRTREEVLGKTYYEVLHELADQPFFKILDDVYTSGIPYHATEDRVDLIRNGKRTTTYYNFTFSPLRDENGNVYGVMNTATEVTDLVRARQQLAEAEESLRGALEVAGMVTWRLDLKNGTMVFSARLKDWFGLSGNSAPISSLINLIHPDDRTRVSAAIELAKNGDGHYESQYRVVRNGKIKMLHSKGRVYKDEAGEPQYMTGTTRDVTIEKLMQEELEALVENRTLELKKANTDLQTVNDNLQQFVYVASHDLQEPLRKINIFTDIILKKHKANLAVEGQGYFTKISDAAQRMSGLLNDLLEFSRVGARKEIFFPTDLNRTISKIVVDYEVLIKQKNASIITDHIGMVDAVPIQMNQLFFNLVGNALKYSNAATSPLIHISSRMLPKHEILKYDRLNPKVDHCEIVVTDNGIGFEQEYAEQIFVIFQRLHRREQFEGTGIGLALCKKIVDFHNGIIFAKGNPGSGASFHIILPVKHVD